MRDRGDEALHSLSKLRRLPSEDERVQIEWRGIVSEIELQRGMFEQKHGNIGWFKSEMLSWMDLFRQPYCRRTAIATAIPFFQQVSPRRGSYFSETSVDIRC